MRRTNLYLAFVAGTLALAVVCADPQPGRGQQKIPVQIQNPARAETKAAEEPKYTDAVTLPRDPEARRLLQAAQDYIRKREWRVAAECLQNLLDAPEDSFIEVTRKNDRGAETVIKASVRAEANRVIGELPTEALEAYRLQFGPAAEDKFKDAVAAADPALLAEISQRYQHTDAGLKATDLLGTYHLDRGQYLMAALCFERLLARPDADKLPPKVLFKAALAYRRAGMATQAEVLFARFADAARRGEVAFGKAKPTLDALRGEYSRDIGGDPVFGLTDWPMFRGNPARSAQGVGGSAYLEPRWSASLTRPEEPLDPRDKPAVTWLEQHLELAIQGLRDKPILPAFFPIAAGGRLLVRAYDGVAAYALKPGVDGKSPGELLWRAPTDLSLFSTVRDDVNGRRMALDQWYNNFYRAGNVGPLGIAFENSVLGAISHDGQRVYFVDDLPIPPHPNMTAGGNFTGNTVNYAPFTVEVEYNRLYSADLDTGKLSWAPLGGKAAARSADGKDARRELNAGTELLDSYFLGPPLPLGGKLYCLTEKNTELRLVCLDPGRLVPSAADAKDKCPELLWVQPLGTANTRIRQDGLRRTHVAHLAYGDGILVCPTNAGAVLGVDLLSHSLVWAFSYRKVQQLSDTDQLNFRRFGRFNPAGMNAGPPGERWRPSAPCIVGNKVVFTAPDGPGSEIHCLNLRDGQPVWAAKRDDANDLYLAGVFGDRVLIVARNHVRALSLDTGKEVWKETRTGLPAGQGTAADGIYYLPLATSADPKTSDKGPEICAIDIRTGAIVGRSKARKESPGNLLFLEGELVSQSPRTVASFPLLKVKQAEIDAALAKNPTDPAGLTDRGELHLYNGAVRDAVADLRLALKQNPSPALRETARAKLHEALTALLQTDFAAGEQYLSEYAALSDVDIPANADAETKQKRTAEQVRRRAAYLELLGRGREKQGRALEAFAAYEQYGELAGHKELVDSLEEPNTRARPDIWSRGRIQALLATAAPADRKAIEAEIAARWNRVRSATGLDDLRKFVALYGPISASGMAARLTLAERLIATGEPDDLAEAERTLAGLCYSNSQRRDDPVSAARATDLMVRVCLRRGQYDNAVGFLRQLADEFPDRVVRDGKTGRELFAELQTDKRFLPYLDAPVAVWSGPLSAKRVPGTFQNRDMAMTIVPEGELLPFLERHRIVLEMKLDGGQTAWSLRMLDRATGEERWRVPGLPAATYLYNAQAAIPFAFARGHELYLHLNNLVIALDLAERKELWRYNLFGKDVVLNSGSNNFALEPPVGVIVVAAEEERKINLGRIALVEAGYVALLTRSGIVALDPTRPGPSVLWQKSDVSPRAQVFGDDQHVFVFDPEADRGRPKFQALRAADGSPVPCHDFTEFYQKKLRTLGGRILVAEPNGAAVRLIDALSGRELWRKDFAPRTIVVKSGDPRLIGAIEPGGLFTLLDGETGVLMLTSRLGPDRVEGMQEATLLADRDRYYLAIGRAADRGMNWNSAGGFGLRSVRTNGPVFALNRRTGKLEWICDFLAHQALLTEQWADLPVLVFASEYSRQAPNGPVQEQGVRVAAVSKATGKLIFDEKFVKQGQFHALNSNAAAGRIELVRQDVKVVLATPDAAARPEPVTPSADRTGRLRNPNLMPLPAVPVAPGGN